MQILIRYTPQTDYASFVGEANFYEPVADSEPTVVVTFFAFVGGDLRFPCYGRLVDDGEADFPAQCFDGLAVGEAVPDDALYIDGAHVFEADVAYDGRRLRVLYQSRTGLDETPLLFGST